MSWASFWLPNLLQATVFAAIGAVVAAIVGLVVRRWLRLIAAQLFGEQQATTAAAEEAASRAGEAVDASRQAVEHATHASSEAKTAGDNSRQANDAIVWLAEQVAVRDGALEETRERIDRLLGTRARQLATEKPAFLVPLDAGTEDDVTSVTGRHRLHTSRIDTSELATTEAYDPYPEEQTS